MYKTLHFADHLKVAVVQEFDCIIALPQEVVTLKDGANIKMLSMLASVLLPTMLAFHQSLSNVAVMLLENVLPQLHVSLATQIISIVHDEFNGIGIVSNVTLDELVDNLPWISKCIFFVLRFNLVCLIYHQYFIEFSRELFLVCLWEKQLL